MCPETYGQMTAADALDAKISALDAKELLQQADLADETEGVFESWAFQAKQVHSLRDLPAAYERCAADDKFDTTLARADMRALQHHVDEIEPDQALDGLPEAYASPVGEDMLEVSLARADMRTLWNRAALRTLVHRVAFGDVEVERTWPVRLPEVASLQNRTEMEQEHAWAAALPEALVTAAENEENEAADAEERECQKCMHPSLALPASPNFAGSCKEGVLVGNQSVNRQKTIDDWARQESECSTTVPDDFERRISLPESPLMAF